MRGAGIGLRNCQRVLAQFELFDIGAGVNSHPLINAKTMEGLFDGGAAHSRSTCRSLRSVSSVRLTCGPFASANQGIYSRHGESL